MNITAGLCGKRREHSGLLAVCSPVRVIRKVARDFNRYLVLGSELHSLKITRKIIKVLTQPLVIWGSSAAVLASSNSSVSWRLRTQCYAGRIGRMKPDNTIPTFITPRCSPKASNQALTFLLSCGPVLMMEEAKAQL
ncbi:MAG: hypothetical protein V4628_10455 [Pseudomonadota bacterium]